MALLHKIATGLGLIPYTLDDIIREAQKGDQEVTVTALRIEFLGTGERCAPGEYRPIAVIGKKHMKIGAPVDVDFNPAEGFLGPMNLRQIIIEGQQRIVEEKLHEYVKKLCDSGINATYKDFNRLY